MILALSRAKLLGDNHANFVVCFVGVVVILRGTVHSSFEMHL